MVSRALRAAHFPVAWSSCRHPRRADRPATRNRRIAIGSAGGGGRSVTAQQRQTPARSRRGAAWATAASVRDECSVTKWSIRPRHSPLFLRPAERKRKEKEKETAKRLGSAMKADGEGRAAAVQQSTAAGRSRPAQQRKGTLTAERLLLSRLLLPPWIGAALHTSRLRSAQRSRSAISDQRPPQRAQPQPPPVTCVEC